jgi:hypothetical protein
LISSFRRRWGGKDYHYKESKFVFHQSSSHA